MFSFATVCIQQAEKQAAPVFVHTHKSTHSTRRITNSVRGHQQALEVFLHIANSQASAHQH